MTRSASVQAANRAATRGDRLRVARERRMALDPERVARDERIDQAVADVGVALEERDRAADAVTAAERNAGEAVDRLLAEQLTGAQVAQLCALTTSEVTRLRSRIGEAASDGTGNDSSGTATDASA
jgi:hypothetical protein